MGETNPRPVLIAGGGIGGLAAALGLAQRDHAREEFGGLLPRSGVALWLDGAGRLVSIRHARAGGHPVLTGVCNHQRLRLLGRPPARAMTVNEIR